MTVCMVLGKNAVDSRILIDGEDITASVRGVEIRAFVGKATEVTITLSSSVDLIADVATVQFGGKNTKAENDGPH